MFFVLSKTLGVMALPTNVWIGVGVLGVALLPTRLAWLGRKLLVVSILLLVVCGFSPVGNLLLYPLEERFPPWDSARGAPDGIVVLGGGIDPDPSAAHGEAVFSSSAGRLIAAAALAHRFPNLRIVYSGGSSNVIADTSTKEADFAVAVFEGLGISRDRLTLERQSRNTFENAEFSKAVAMPKPGERWLLVTSAHHLPRAIGVFRKAGFPVEAYPVDWRTRGINDVLRPFATVGDGLRRSDTAVREWVGLAVYWVTGRSSALFPGPTQDNP